MSTHPGWKNPLQNIRDSISFATNAPSVRDPAFAVVDALQFYSPRLQLDAIYAVAVAMSQTLNLDPHMMVNRAVKMQPEIDGPFSEQLNAIRDYAAGELR